jgi:two-component sensor histidine kinase/PAS domain-containing protein
VLNSEGVILAVNAPWQKFANENGPSAGSTALRTGVGSNYLSVCGADDAASVTDDRLNTRQGIQAVLSGRQLSFTMEYPCHSPQEQRWFSMNVTPLAQLGQGVVVSHTNITSRRLAEQALRGVRDHLQTTLNAIPDLLFEVDADGCILNYHAHRSDLLAAPPEVFMGKSFAEILPPLASTTCMGALKEAAANGSATGAIYSLPLAHGETWFELSVAAMPVLDGAAPRFILLTRDVTDRIQSQHALQTSLREKSALLLELHHRVKNNLQVITSLLRLESLRSTDGNTKSVLQDMQSRVRSMALLHETVYRKGSFAAIDLGSYIGQVAAASLKTLQSKTDMVQLRLNVGEVQVGLEQAAPTGMLISELVSNSLKHAFPEGRGGEIDISLLPNGESGQWRLRMSDDGIGLPADFEALRQRSFGLQLAGDMAIQMGGELHIGDGPAAVFTVDFKAKAQKPFAIT